MIRQCMATGKPLPKKIQNAPELEPGLWFYMQAFLELESERHIGLDIGPIPRNAIRDYAIELELTDEEFDDLYYHVRALDIAFLKFRAKKRKA